MPPRFYMKQQWQHVTLTTQIYNTYYVNVCVSMCVCRLYAMHEVVNNLIIIRHSDSFRRMGQIWLYVISFFPAAQPKPA